jgi:glycosyltransferase involved in cell wall biosynthesis
MWNLLSIVKTALCIRKINPDIIHMQSGVYWELLLKKVFREIPLVMTVHDIRKHHTWAQGTLLYKWQQSHLNRGSRMSNAVIVHGPTLKRQAEEHFRGLGFSKQIYSLPHGVISRYGSGVARHRVEGVRRILFFGYINRYKGIEYLIEAEPLIRKSNPDVQIRIIGKTEMADYYKNLVHPGQHIELDFNYQNDGQVSALFQWADVLVLPYIEASQSGVLQLGMSFGIPPVVTSVGGLPDVVEHEKTGLLVPPGDVASLANAINRLLLDENLRRNVIGHIIAARASVFSWSSIAEQTLDVYRETIDRMEITRNKRSEGMYSRE